MVDAGLMKRPWDGRAGRPWAKLRKAVLDESDVCGICGHAGSDTVDHIIARAERPDLAEVRDNLQPAHGVSGCPTCHRKCQNEKSSKRTSDELICTEDWFA
jgi:5-methylcytosine-specific restriction endonuclease McrA